MNAKAFLVVSILILSLFAFTNMSTAAERDISKAPPAEFKKVSSLVKLPDYLPGMGTLYVNPATLPYGPFLGYDKKDKLVNVIYMVPTKDLDEHKAIDNLGKDIPGLKINHVDFMYNPGHPGVPEPHYHITLWLIGHDEQMETMK